MSSLISISLNLCLVPQFPTARKASPLFPTCDVHLTSIVFNLTHHPRHTTLLITTSYTLSHHHVIHSYSPLTSYTLTVFITETPSYPSPFIQTADSLTD